MRTRTVWMAMALFAFVTLFLVSADSYTHDYYDHHDSATFFASGKAWFSGMVPYVDFSDSKGPLLWFIYGVAYLLSPRTMLGVFWLTVVAYTFIFYWLYKTARVYLDNDVQATMASMLTAVSIFFPMVRYETRAEDFGLFFLVWALSHVCRLLHGGNVADRRQLRQASVVLGVGMAATLLIKYNVMAVLGVMALFVLHYAWRQRLCLWRAMGWMAMSAAAVLTPCVAYMLWEGCFDDFVREYFVNTMQLVARQHERMGHPLFLLIAHRYTVGLYLLVNAISALAIGWWVRRYRLFVAVVFAATVLVAVANAFWLYYYAICGVFVCFGVVALMRWRGRHRQRWGRVALTATATVALVLVMHLTVGDRSWFFSDNAERKAFYEYAYIMSRVQRPRLIYYNTNTIAFGVPVQSLPGCRFWISQSGATPDMDADQLRAIKNREADFVFALKAYDNPALFDSLGYHRCDNDSRLPMLMYARDSIVTPPPDYRVSNTDILLKRFPH